MPDSLKRQERLWERLYVAAARARAALEAAWRQGVSDHNAAKLLRGQRAADAAEQLLIAFETRHRRRARHKTKVKRRTKTLDEATTYRSAPDRTLVLREFRRTRA